MNRDAQNPYAPPIADAARVVEAGGELETLRRTHVDVESDARTVGLLAFMGGVCGSLFAAMLLSSSPIAGALGLLACAVALLAGFWLRKLEMRGPKAFLAMIGLIVLATTVSRLEAGTDWQDALKGLLVPTLVVLALMRKLVGPRAQLVFSAYYRDVVIPATPHVRPKTPIVAAALLVLVVLGLLAAIVAVLAG